MRLLGHRPRPDRHVATRPRLAGLEVSRHHRHEVGAHPGRLTERHAPPSRAEILDPALTSGLPAGHPLPTFAAATLDRLGALLRAPDDLAVEARLLVERLALSLQGSLMLRYAPPAAADAWIGARLGSRAGRTFGALPADLLPAAARAQLLDRALSA